MTPLLTIDQVYEAGLTHFFKTYLVYGFCLSGMLLGLALGKNSLTPASPETVGHSPRIIYFVGSLLANLCILGCSFIAETSFDNNFWVYATLMGFMNGMFSGIAYQAPMLAC